MAETQIRFTDGAAYERFMGVWSRLAGDVFIDWLAPPPGLRWVDVGCGNGAFTELLIERCSAQDVQGVDPSDASSPLRAPGPARAPRNSMRAMPWRCPLPKRVLTRPRWRW
jgi:hypothetical protein